MSTAVLTGAWPLPVATAALVLSASVLAYFGTGLARNVDRLADRTGVGEALAGAVLLGGATSLAGLAVTVVAAASGEASLAVSNAVGGIAAQTAFIVLLDLVYRRANLEHAAASVENLFNSLLMLTLLATAIVGVAAPPVTILGVHPATLVLVLVYGYGLRISRSVNEHPMWRPLRTGDTETDEPDEPPVGETMAGLVVRFLGMAFTVAVSGWMIGRAGLSMVEATDLSGTFVAVVFTAVATSLPELVTGMAAIRAGALTLAVAGIIGGNTFDILFIAVADGVYREGSIYAAVATSDLFVLAWTMLMTGILGAGLVRRQRGGIGFEGMSILVVYLAGLVIVHQMS